MPVTGALLCDAMGTLVRLAPPAPALRRGLSERHGVSVSLQQAQAAIAAEISYYRSHMLEGRDAASVRRLQMRCAQELRAALPSNGRLDAIDADAMTAVLLDALHFELFEDALPALQRVRSAGWCVVVVSNWDQSLGSVLARVGLGPLLDGVVTSAEVGAGKPDPAVFRAALELTGVTPAQAVHVGDSLEEDVAGARAAGIRAIWLARHGSPGSAAAPAITGLDQLAGQLWP